MSSNRAACHLKLGQWGECIEDCNKVMLSFPAECLQEISASGRAAAMETLRARLLKEAAKGEVVYGGGNLPEAAVALLETQRKLVLKAHMRKGNALVGQSRYGEAAASFLKATRLLGPEQAYAGTESDNVCVSKAQTFANNRLFSLHLLVLEHTQLQLRSVRTQLAADMTRALSQQESLEKKENADLAFRSGKLDEALGKYNLCLERDGNFVSALSNRAAVHLALGHNEAAIADCTRALELLNNAGGAAGAESSPTGPCPLKQSAKWRAWVAKTTIRRGTALHRLGGVGKIKLALEDYESAARLDPGNEKLQQDVKTLREELDGVCA